MRTLGSVGLIAMAASVAAAQPAPDPYPQQQGYPPPQQQGYPPPQQQGYPPPAQQYPQQYPQQNSGGWPAGAGAPGPYQQQQQPMQVQLTIDEQYLLERGFISDGEYLGGGIASLFIGFGVGQAIQGRWADKGWIFTVGEGLGIAGMIYGISRLDSCNDRDGTGYENGCNDDSIAIFGISMLSIAVFRVWEVVDAFAAPPAHNRKVRALRGRLGLPVPMYTLSPYVVPSKDYDGGTAGVSFRF